MGGLLHLDCGPNFVMRHFVITRINVPMNRGNQWREPEWIEDRLEKLARWSAPSVHAQECQDFEYLWIACRAESETTTSKIERAGDSLGARILWMNPMEQGSFKKEIATIAPPEDLDIAVTRLDSDDVLHRQFVSLIQSKFRSRSERFFVINPLIGVMSVDGRATLWPYVASNFLTSVHRRQHGEELRTAYDFSHDEVHQFAPVEQVVSRPLWLFNVHDTNGAVREMRGIHVPNSFVKHRFPILESMELKRWSPRLTVRSASRFVARSRRPDSKERVKSLIRR